MCRNSDDRTRRTEEEDDDEDERQPLGVGGRGGATNALSVCWGFTLIFIWNLIIH